MVVSPSFVSLQSHARADLLLPCNPIGTLQQFNSLMDKEVNLII